MHVKEQVKEFVHDVKRRFSGKHKRDTYCTFESYDNSSAESISHLDDSSSASSISTRHSTSQSRFAKFIRPRSSSRKFSFYKGRNEDGKRRRFFSMLTVPSGRMVESHLKQPVSYQGAGSSGVNRSLREAYRSSQDYSDVIDVSARVSVKSEGSTTTTVGTPPTLTLLAADDGESSLSLSQPQFDRESSDTSGTLLASSTTKSVSESDESSEKMRDSDWLVSSNVVVVPNMADTLNEDIALARSITSSPPRSPPPVPQVLRIASPAQQIRSRAASPAPAYIPRLTAPSMFLPIPNVFLAITLFCLLAVTLPPHLLVSYAQKFLPSIIPTFEATADHPTDPLSALLTKYVPAEQRPRRDVAGEYAGRDVHEMVMSNSWRALAKMARDRIVASDPEDLGRILDLWSLRLSSLARLRLTNQASAECTNLFAVLNAVHATAVPGTFPGSAHLPPSSPSPAAHSPLSPSGLSNPTPLPGTPSQKPSSLPSSLVHPFELTVFHARVHYWSGDPLGYVDALGRILRQCKERAREEGRIVVQRKEISKTNKAQGDGDTEPTSEPEQASEGQAESEDDDDGADDAEDVDGDGSGEDAEESTENDGEVREEVKEEPDEVLATAEANLSMWLERIARVCLILASQMIEMNDYQAAINLLAPLCTHRTVPTFQPTPTPELHSALARVYLLSGNLLKAEKHFSIAASAAANSANGSDVLAMNAALLAAASGDWTRAEEALSEIVSKDPGNFTAINNLAVTLLSQGRIKEGIDLLEAALKTSPSSVVVAEPFLFNLSTLYELRSTAAIDKKRGLLIEVAKWSGDGLKTSCLKMPSS